MKSENTIVLSFTNKAIQNVQKRLLKTSVKNVNEKCFTFDSFFRERFGSTVEDLKDKEMFFRRVLNDTGKIYWYDLSRFLLFRNKIWLFGNTNECSPVEAGSQISYDYDRICFVLQMTGKVKTLGYKEGCGKYDKETYDMLQEFLKTKRLINTSKKQENLIRTFVI